MIDIQKVNQGIVLLDKMQQQNAADILNLCNEHTDHQQNEKLLSLIQNCLVSNTHIPALLDGYYPLRENISKLIENDYSFVYHPESEITITAGAANAIATAISAFVKEGDEVIIFEPSFFTYAPVVLANGGRPTYIKLKLPDFHIDWDEVQKGITVNTRMIIINSPHNPTGKIFNAQDMERLARIVNGTKIIILSDESFDRIIYEGYEHQSIARYPKLAERSIAVFSFGKSLLAEGWKIGFCLAPEKLTETFRKFHHIFSMSVNLPFQVVISELLGEKSIFEGKAKQLEGKRNLLNKGLKNSRFKVNPSSGTYFQIVNYAELSDEKDTDFCTYLLEKYRLAVMPLSYFYHDSFDNKYFRICFSVPDETIDRALVTLNSL
jgi:methionine transaminase